MSSIGAANFKQLNAQPEMLTDRFLRWHPSGEFLTQIDSNAGAVSLFLIPLNGGETQIVPGFGKDNIRSFAWSPSGNQMAAAQITENQDLVVINNF